jgi:hypothetical protein
VLLRGRDHAAQPNRIATVRRIQYAERAVGGNIRHEHGVPGADFQASDRLCSPQSAQCTIGVPQCTIRFTQDAPIEYVLRCAARIHVNTMTERPARSIATVEAESMLGQKARMYFASSVPTGTAAGLWRKSCIREITCRDCRT